MKDNIKKILIYLSSFFCLLCLWQFFSVKENAALIIPSPFDVFKIIIKILPAKSFWICFANTFLRVIKALFITVFFGVLIGILSDIFVPVREFMVFPLSLIKTTPVIAVILMALFLFTSDTLPVFVAFLMAFPVMIKYMEAGLKNAPLNLIEMSKVYHFSKIQTMTKIKLPFAKESLISGIEAVFSLCWKVTVAGEVLSLPKRGIGTLLNMAQVHLESSEVFGITILLVTFSFMIEKILTLLLSLFCNKKCWGIH